MRMQNRFKLSFLSLLAILGSPQAYAQALLPSISEFNQVWREGKTSLTLDLENDSLLLKRDDGFYTSGNHLDMRKTRVDPNHAISYGWHIGQDLYTASDIKLHPAQIKPQDHPYAGWLYLGAFKENEQADGSASKLSLDLGCLGPCAGGEWTQTNLHRLFRQPLPRAWNTQLKQEWGAVLGTQWSPARLTVNSGTDIGSRFKARIGNIFTDASAEMLWRYGQLNTLSSQASSHIFARAELKLVGYNATLQGGYFNAHQAAITPKRLVPELELGYQYRGQVWGFYASVIRRNSEIKELPNAKAAQNIGKIQITYVM